MIVRILQKSTEFIKYVWFADILYIWTLILIFIVLFEESRLQFWQRNNISFSICFSSWSYQSDWWWKNLVSDEGFIYIYVICLHLLQIFATKRHPQTSQLYFAWVAICSKIQRQLFLIFLGIYTKLKDRNCDIKDRLKLAKFAWFSDKVILPNKEQVLIDFLSGLLLNKKR